MVSLAGVVVNGSDSDKVTEWKESHDTLQQLSLSKIYSNAQLFGSWRCSRLLMWCCVASELSMSAQSVEYTPHPSRLHAGIVDRTKCTKTSLL